MRSLGLALLLACGVPSGTAYARPGMHTLRLEATFAAFVAEPATSRFGVGGGGALSYEFRPVPLLGIEARYGALFFAPAGEPEFGGYHAPGLGVRVHPLPDLELGDLWVGATADLVMTGQLARPGVSAGLGFEFELSSFARLGPFARFHWVMQPDDDALGPDDASFVSFGVSGAFLGEPAPQAALPPDEDGDGVPDANDRCPGEAEDHDGIEDDDGCPDLDDGDHDGVPDVNDRCPGEAEDRDGIEDDDGCPDVDDGDQDGVPDASDACVAVPEDRDGFEDEDGCPDLDNDLDGIADAGDACPEAPETRNGYLDADGCPDEVEREISDVAERVFFESSSAELSAAARTALQRVVTILNAHLEITQVRIEGHADARGSEQVNRDLSERRAVTVRNHLVAQGVADHRLTLVAHGESRLLARGDEDDAHAQNRRVQFTVMEIGGRPVRSR
jgi:outer membrane protein OmpA-like peptidoglycan-associated protein